MAKATTKSDGAATKKAATKTAGAKTSETKAGGSGRGNALQQPVEYSDDLAAIVGKGPLPRSQVTSKIWEYIRENKLQAEDDRRNIKPDTKLGKVIGNDTISMFKMTSAVNKHFK